ncbi:hypothetical protein G7046_g9130 [Stylonectria norvegica]|nr:hypothetical protein G7046_g9130 [Stylonectria norvegica]
MYMVPSKPRYEYSEIKTSPRAFRLVRLLPPARSIFGNTVRIEIVTTNVDEPCSYDALSYAWNVLGPGPPDRRVIVKTSHGEQELRIHRPLEVALLELKTDQLLFVDQICINQKDDAEKATQVQLMREIYTKCDRAVVWLGSGTKLSDAYLDYNREICEEGILGRLMGPHVAQFPLVFEAVMDPNVAVEGTVREDRDDLLDLISRYGNRFPLDGHTDVLSRAWFTRLWIIQEACLVPNVVIVCGSRSLCFDCFRAGCLFYSVYNTHWVGNVKGSVSKSELAQRNEIFDLTKSLARIFQERKAIHTVGQKKSLYELVMKYSVNDNTPKIGASVAEDRLYALMGLAETQSLSEVNVRYGDTRRVFIEFAGLLARHNMDAILFSQFPKRVSGLPSWVPDWSMDLKIPHGYETLTEPVFSAGEVLREPPRVDIEAGRLVVQGVVVDRIVRVGKRTMQKDPEAPVMDQIDYRSAKRFNDEIVEFLQGREKDVDDAAAIRLSDFGLLAKHFSTRDDQDAAVAKMKVLHAHVNTWGQRLINTDNTVQSFHLTRIAGRMGILPWYWRPASEIDTLHLAATKPITACATFLKTVGFFLFDFVQLAAVSARVILHSKVLELQRRFTTRMDFSASKRVTALSTVGLDPNLNKDSDMNRYTDNLLKNVGQKLYRTHKRYVGSGPGSLKEGDVVVVLFGGTNPYILRQKDSSAEEELWEYVGEAYCDGVMDGEALDGKEVTFNLV